MAVSRSLACLLADGRYMAAATASREGGRLLLLPWLLHVAERQHAATGDGTLPLSVADLGALARDVPAEARHLASCLELALAAGLAEDVGDGRVQLVHGPRPRRRKPSDSPERVLARVQAHRLRARNAVTPPVTPRCNAVTPGVTPQCNAVTPPVTPSVTPPVTPGAEEGVTEGVTPAEGGVTPPVLRVERGGVTPGAEEGVTGGVTGGASRAKGVNRALTRAGTAQEPTTPPLPPRGVTPPVTPPEAPPSPAWSARVFELHREATGGEPTKGSLRALKPLVRRYGEGPFLERLAAFYASPARRFGLRYLAENYGTFDAPTPGAAQAGPLSETVSAFANSILAARAERAGGAGVVQR